MIAQAKIIRCILFALVLVASSAAFTFVSAESHISIHIVKPGDRRNIPTGDSPVAVEIRGADVAQGYYWELYADQLPTATIRDGSTSATVNFRRTGPHRIKVVLFDAQGNRVSSHEILVIAAPVESRAPIFNREQFAPAMAILTFLIISIIGGGLWFSRRVNKNVYAKSELENEIANVHTESARIESL